MSSGPGDRSSGSQANGMYMLTYIPNLDLSLNLTYWNLVACEISSSG